MTPLAALADHAADHAAEREGPPDAAEFAAMEAELRRFVRHVLRPAEPRLAADDAVPEEIVAELRRMGPFRTFEGTSQIQQLRIARRMIAEAQR
jgi:alkylation response protein AidB-like acyl-CoA dehydrogenase